MKTPPATSGPAPTASRGFRAGVLRRGPAVPLVAVALVFVLLGALNFVFTSGLWTVVPVEYCLRDDDDTSTYVSWTVGRNKRAPSDLPSVYLLGGSSAREALLSGPSLARDIALLGGPVVEAWNVASSNQDFAETFAIVDNVPSAGTWVVIGVGPGRFTASPRECEQEVVGIGVLTRSDRLQRYVARESGRYGANVTILPGILRYLGGVLGEAVASGGPVRHEYQPFKYSVERAYTPAQKDGMVATWFERAYPRFRANVGYNLALLEEVVVCAQERGLHVVLVELPLNHTAVRGRFDRPLSLYRGPVRVMAGARGVPYLDLERDDPLPSSDFHDLVHLVEPGRARWQRRLAEELVRLMALDAAVETTAAP